MNPELSLLSLDAYGRERQKFLLARLAEMWARCADRADPDAIHDLRVAVRRFGEVLRLFKSLAPKASRKQVQRELRRSMRLAGRTRDVDILRDSFTHADIPLPRSLALYLENERAAAEAGLRAALAVGNATHFHERWRETLLLDQPGVSTGGEAISQNTTDTSKPAVTSAPAGARLMLPGLLEEYCAKGERLAQLGTKPAKLHGLRLAGKHLRYSLEIFRPIYGRRMDDLLGFLRDTQGSLGQISDATASIAWLYEAGLEQSAEICQLQIYLEQRAQKGASRFTEYWVDHWGLPSFRQHWISYLTRYAGHGPIQQLLRRSTQPGPGASDASPSPDVVKPPDVMKQIDTTPDPAPLAKVVM
jgi:CHAD domain-containing protein